ncbi:anti-sigma F factor antagonist [Clostridium formicaceticum]|uniref:Anti-sigma F factor antagonist n=1 Tax=Clostridium formicaceticum TaxID=1497 RepID=A0AAC9RKY9_9CLOT|nr:anti-sigma F factor antagonist [Clostridium formicaceticum]AOY76761.1 anti-sigma F factor antagonist [Clostridium formicaceticum]ARE87213.1 Anti-sigma F factor antagonist [Clostridium formicaceticum]
MQVHYENIGNTLIVKLRGELDHHVAEKIRVELDEMISNKRSKNLIFDLKEMNFMDSSGIGVIIGRYKNIHKLGGKVAVVQASNKVDKIFSLAGLYRIVSKFETSEDALKCI